MGRSLPSRGGAAQMAPCPLQTLANSIFERCLHKGPAFGHSELATKGWSSTDGTLSIADSGEFDLRAWPSQRAWSARFWRLRSASVALTKGLECHARLWRRRV